MPDHHTVEHKPDHPERKRYLKKKPLREALEVFLNATAPTRRTEIVAVEEALHRTTAEPIFALISSPHYHGAAMDGIAVRAEDTFGASEFSAVRLKSAGAKESRPSPNGAQPIFQYVDTGSPLPPWANAVVMIERVFKKNDAEVEIRDAATPWQHVRLVGELPAITAVLEKAIKDHDSVVIIAGSSAGEHDFTVRALESLGEVLVHGIDVMPGKPAILALIGGKPVIGLPGYPVSAVVICQQILRPLLARFLGRPAEEPQKITAFLPRKIPSRLGLEEFVRVSLGKVGDRIIVNPLGRGAGVITTMVKADGVLRIPSLDEGLNAGQEVEVELLRPVEEIANTILFTGSNDLTIGVLDDQLRAQSPGLRISASNIGSLAGLVALRRGEAHIIGTHLLDPASGTYNLPDLKKQQLLSKVVVMNLVIREQGLIVPLGNPKKIKGLKDLARKDVIFINRQPGAGTRVLLDYKLGKLKIKPEQVRGYEREEVTHMAVAVAVASGLADTGLGIKSAAKALGLDFVPVEREDYDLVFLKDFFASDMGQKLVEVIRSEAFKQAVEQLDGYDTAKTGVVKKA